MAERLSFYIARGSPLHRLNPLTKITIVFALILVSFSSPFFWTAPLLLVLVILPLSFIGRVQREYLLTALKLLVPATGFVFIMQSLFLPGGQTLLFQFWFLHLYLEPARAAFLTVARIFVMVSAFIVFLLSTHPSELMTDLTRRGLPGQFAYVIVSTLQILPQMQAKAQTIIAAQRSRGLDTQGSFLKRIGALVPLVGPLVFGSLVEVEERAIAIEARGFTSPARKTSLREIPDTATDRVLRWGLAGLVLVSLILSLWLRR
jgi:energy-coupling factor transport system permease protein